MPTENDRVIEGLVERKWEHGNLVNIDLTGVTEDCGGVIVVNIEQGTEVRRRDTSGAVVSSTTSEITEGMRLRALPYFVAQSCPPQYGVEWVEIQP